MSTVLATVVWWALNGQRLSPVPPAPGPNWLYLAMVIDCHSKAVIGWSMAEHTRTDLICDPITLAAANAELAPGAVFHSDHGSFYTGTIRRHQDKARNDRLDGLHGCGDNAMRESFFVALKNEAIDRAAFTTRQSAGRDIVEYIRVIYNRIRLHFRLATEHPTKSARVKNHSLAEYLKNHLLAA